MNDPNFLYFFQSKQKVSSIKNGFIFNQYNIGELVLVSGKLVACDPLVFPDSVPFTTHLTPGRYPVILSVAQNLESNDCRVAYAVIELSKKHPVRWEMATVPGQDISLLNEGKIFGYGVDSGTGAFMDWEVGKIIDSSLINEEEFEDSYPGQLLDLLEKNYHPTWCWANMPVSELPEANAIAFSSGWGDGFYATYFGYDTDNNIVSVVTDFCV